MDIDVLDLEFSRRLQAPRGAVWRCWTEAELLRQWFCPKPWVVSDCTIDLRPGGLFHTVMRGPEGQSHDNPGLWLEVAPLDRLAFSNLMTEGWRPVQRSEGFALSVVVTFREAPGNSTFYTARALHGTVADRDAHAAMGFDAGWGAAATQLEALAAGL